MKKSMCFLMGAMLLAPAGGAFADPVVSAVVAATSYVDQAIATKQNTLSSANGGNITVSGTGNVVTGITASSGTVTVAKANIQVPIGSSSATTYAGIWVQ